MTDAKRIEQLESVACELWGLLLRQCRPDDKQETGMANFKVGDMVRVISTPAGAEGFGPLFLGQEGVIVGYEPEELLPFWVDLPGLPEKCHPHSYGFDEFPGIPFGAEHLAPLTPPAVDTWAGDKVRELFKPKPQFQGLPLENVQ